MSSGAPSGAPCNPMETRVLHDLCATYLRRWGVPLFGIDVDGGWSAKSRPSCCDALCASRCMEVRKRALEESLRWGEPCPMLCPAGYMIWSVPLMHNVRLTGGLFAVGLRWGSESLSEEGREEVRTAAADLLIAVSAANLTNAAELRLRRQVGTRERGRAEAIHIVKEEPFGDLRSAYLKEEPVLLAAVERADAAAAKAAVNRMLTVIYFHGARRLPVLKSFLLELVVRMCRAAAEAGAHAEEVFGGSYARLVELSGIENEEDLSDWLVAMLDRLLLAMQSAPRRLPNEALIAAALDTMRKQGRAHALSRNAVARSVGMSPAHFSRLFHAVTGRTFGTVMTDIRMDEARRLLSGTAASLAEVAQRCGYSDQSHFTRVFRRWSGCTPGRYRARRI